jgi:hypothetical protein
LQGQTLTLPQRQQLLPPRRVPTSGRSRRLYPRRSAQTGLRLPPAAPQQQASGGAQEAQGADTGAGADTDTDAGAVNDTHKSSRARKPKRHLGIVRIAQSVTPVTVIHPTASAQSQVATLHLFARELLKILVVPVAIAMLAPHGIGSRPAVRIVNRRLLLSGAKTNIQMTKF